MDASLPTTMYNIDIYSNTVYLTKVTKSSVCIDDSVKYLMELTGCNHFSMIFEESFENYLYVCSELQVQQCNIPIPLMTSSFVYGINNLAIRYIIENTNIAMKTNQTESEYFFFDFQSVKYCIKRIASNASLINIICFNNFYLELNSTNLYDVVYFNFTSLSSNRMAQNIENGNNYWVKVNNYRYKLSMGNYNIQTLRTALSSAWSSLYNISVNQIGSFDDTFQARYRLTSPECFMINGKKNSLDGVIGFSLYPGSDVTNFKGITIGSNSQIFMSVFNSSAQEYEITPPSLINLRGARYLILRCKELEDLLYGSYSYNSCTPGLGMFKLEAGQNASTSLRWDFASVKRKPIHPIGKLSMLTFRFELTNGALYDFKGVNHQFLLAVKFYAPSKTTTYNKSTLNPSYNPNLIQYMSSSKGIKQKEDSDHEDEIDDEESYNYFQKQMKLYDYSTSEDESV